jgi:hypothetical protein
MKESWLDTLWNEEIRRRCGVVDITEKVRESLRWYGHVIRRDEGELVRYIMERRDQKKMWGGRHYREGEGSKVEMVWTRNKKR